MEQVAPPKELRPSPLLRKAGRHRRYLRWRDTASAAISCRNGPVALPVLPYGIMARHLRTAGPVHAYRRPTNKKQGAAAPCL